ncbi:helix-turn-helix transcriptional regulator [Chroococcidiopsis sp. CCMEE 29]|uniref:helix-turn-helix domain-containing protein n=1 Tax=Chroococcidiopsis sp. CCMEE 29 TaxID=155894 RepID=UPI0031F9F476
MRKVYCRLAVLMAEKDPKLTQTRLRDETGLAIQTINQLFHSSMKRVDLNTIETLCEYFNVEVGDLFVLREVSEPK